MHIEHPRSWWLAATLLLLGTTLLIWVSAPYQIELANARSAQILERVTANLTEEQAQMARQRIQSLTLSRYWLQAAGTGIVIMGLGWIARAGFIHFTSAALGGTSNWPATFATLVWSMLPFFLRDLLQAAFVMINGRLIEHQGLAFLVASGDWLADSRSVLYALLSSIDPFYLWHIVLLSVAITVATKISRGKATALAIIVCALFLGLKMIPVAISAAVGAQL